MTTSEYWESNYKIKLNCDISFIFFKKFNPIEDFKGDFDGGGHTIKYVMLRYFVKNNHGTISRLNFQKSKLLSSRCGFVENNYGTISECTSIGKVEAELHGDFNMGGFVLYNRGAIKDSSAKITVIGAKDGKRGKTLGVFAACNDGAIINCNAKGNIRAHIIFCSYSFQIYENVGGFVGVNNGKITNCIATGNVNCKRFTTNGSSRWVERCAGGFAGRNRGTISECTSKVDVKGEGIEEKLGGFVGNNIDNGIITNCTAMGKIDGKKINFDRFAGENKGKIEDCKIN